MKIGYVVHRYSPDIGGVETHVEQIATRLARNGHDIEVLTQTERPDVPVSETSQGIHILRFYMPAATRSLEIAPGLWRVLVGTRPQYDIVHAHNYHSPPALAATLQPSPLVFTPHYHGTGHAPLRHWLHLPYRVPGAFLFARSRRVICVSQAEQDLLVRHFPFVRDRTTVIPNGVNTALLSGARPFPDTGHIVLLSVGRLENYKRMDRVLDAMRYLDDRFICRIIGRGSSVEALQRRIALDNLSNRVEILPNVDNGMLARWLRSADVFVLLSEHESFSITPREALAAGANVVISDISAHREIARAAGVERVTLVPMTAEPSEVAELIRSTALRPRAVREYLPATWDEVASETLNVYQDAISSKRAGADSVSRSS